MQRDQQNLLLEKQRFVRKIISAGKPWSDPDFAPTIDSLLKGCSAPEQETSFKRLEWKRASEIYKKAEVFQAGITPCDVNQGALGDCYFLAVCSSMAEEPERVMALFETKEANKCGIYMVKLFINGVVTPVIVDDYLPTIYNKPAFASSQDSELWVALLEKAWAKLHGSYALT